MSKVNKLGIGGAASMAKVNMSQYMMVKKMEDKIIQLVFKGDDVKCMIFKIEGIVGDSYDECGKDFENGQYIGEIWQTALNEPPQFKVYTPNGVYATNTANICTEISKYHQQNYRPELKIYGFLINMVGVMKNWKSAERGIGLMYDGDVATQSVNISKYAKSSKEWNAKYYQSVMNDFKDDNVGCGDLCSMLKEVAIDEQKIEKDKSANLDLLNASSVTRSRPVRRGGNKK